MENNNKKVIMYVLVAFVVICTSTYLGYLYMTSDDEYKSSQNEMVLNKVYPIASSKTVEPKSSVNTITKNTDIQYNYKENGVLINTVTSKAPNSLVNFTEQELKNTLEDMSVVSFNKDLVVLEKNTYTEKSSFIVGDSNGFVSVFYKDTNDNITLVNQTRVPIEPLPEQDKKLLEQGINAKDDAELIKIIEDYQS